jgi:hypothetical protein
LPERIEREKPEENIVEIDIAEPKAELQKKLKEKNSDGGNKKELHPFREKFESGWGRVIA